MNTHRRNASIQRLLRLEWIRGWYFIFIFVGWWEKRKDKFPAKKTNRKDKKKLKMRMRDIPF